MKLLPALIAAVGLFATACATNQKHETVKLEALPAFDMAYSGEVGSWAVGEMPESASPKEESKLAYLLMTRVLRGSAAEAEAQFGDRVHSIGVWSVDTAEVGTGKLTAMEMISAPSMIIREGANGRVEIGNNTAYISGFEVSGKADTRIADPVIETVVDGLVLDLRTESVGENEVRLAIDLQFAELLKPIATQEVRVLGAPMTVQTPVIFSQRLKSEGTASEGKTLVLTGMMRGDEVYVILIKATRQTLEDKDD